MFFVESSRFVHTQRHIDSARHIAEPIVEDDFHDEHDNYGNQKKSNRKAGIATVANER